MDTQGAAGAAARGNENDTGYHGLLARLNARFLANTDGGAAPLFTTDAENLWSAYLDTFTAPADRQRHTCHACRCFVERFGNLVTIDTAGMTAPALWHEDDAPGIYKPAIAAMAQVVRRARVTGVFLSSAAAWGTPERGGWHHLAVTPPAALVFTRATQTARQAMAEKRENFKTVMHALDEFTQPMLEQVLTLLRSEALYRSEKVLGQAEWLHGLHVVRRAARGDAKAASVWRAVALAPAGFCHPRSSMIGTLLQDIAAGMAFGDVSRRFAAKMHPLQYQRPQAAPSAGAIAAAEKLMQQLGAAGSLARRFARLDEVMALWKPAQAEDSKITGGVFGHLKPKPPATAPSMQVPAQTMTWDKFQRTVLPTAERIEFFARNARDSYAALVTAVNADAPPILQWDLAEARNPVSWYVWHGGSTPGEFSLAADTFHTVAALALKPPSWKAEPGAFAHQGDAIMFIIDGARETKQAGAAIFPEFLRAELHGIRSVIEAYSRGAKIEGMGEPHAAGIVLSKGGSWNALLRVTTGGRSQEYMLDRWD
jgi:hypothetical protein